ncbi:MAG: tetratricopeptide repeat protein [Desulfobacteraceae bacterium]|nr:tetratricopeptide repeat protein [Desulfobacteraceae bacterium]MBC2756751.1 tetratricopeptide repeat protein [Desulfobacteraceae bacterium]
MRHFLRMVLVILSFMTIISGCSTEPDKTVEELNNDAISLLEQQNISEALNVAEKALKKAEDEYGFYDPAVLKSLQIIAIIYQAKKDYLNAEFTYKQALSASKVISGENSLHSLKIMNNIGSIKYLQNQFEPALSIYKQALSIAEKELGSDDPLLLQIQNNMATCESALKSGKTPGADIEEPPAASLKKGTDFVPDEVKSAALKKMASQNILLDNPQALLPIQIGDQGMVFPYLYTQNIEESEGGGGVKVVLLFAAIKNKDKKDVPGSEEGSFYVFNACRMVSYESYVEEIEKGSQETAIPAIISVFPNLYSQDG